MLKLQRGVLSKLLLTLVPSLETLFHLQQVEDEQFFREWQDDLPEITDWQKQLLDSLFSPLSSWSSWSLEGGQELLPSTYMH